MYKRLGTCIFCGRDESTGATFKEKPHTFPRAAGGDRIGFDVCDECNHFFGQPDNSATPHIGVELACKEVFGAQRALLRRDKNPPNLRSVFFEYRRSKHKWIFKNHFKESDENFLLTFGRQFRRAMYEVFLQEYHYATQNGLDPSFDNIRNFARYGVGDVPLYYVTHRIGVYFMENGADGKFIPHITIAEPHLKEIEDYGFVTLYLFGQSFILEVKNDAERYRKAYLQKTIDKLSQTPSIYSGIQQIDKITDMDFLLTKLFS